MVVISEGSSLVACWHPTKGCASRRVVKKTGLQHFIWSPEPFSLLSVPVCVIIVSQNSIQFLPLVCKLEAKPWSIRLELATGLPTPRVGLRVPRRSRHNGNGPVN